MKIKYLKIEKFKGKKNNGNQRVSKGLNINFSTISTIVCMKSLKI